MKTIKVTLTNGLEHTFRNAGYHEKQLNTVTIYDESYAIVAEFYKQEIRSLESVEMPPAGGDSQVPS